MKKMLPMLIPMLLFCIIAAAVGGYFLYQSFTGPMYQPGMVRTEKDLRAPLDPPAQPDEPGAWLVEPDIRLHYFSAGEGEPVLVLHGAENLQSEETSRTYMEIYPGARFEVIPGATHFAFEENAAEFARVVQEFRLDQ